MEREERDAWFGREKHDDRFGRFGLVRGFSRPGTFPLQSSSEMYIYKGEPGGSGGSGSARTGRGRPATVESETP